MNSKLWFDSLDWLRRTDLLGIPLNEWAVAVAVALLSCLVMTFGLRLALSRLEKLVTRTDNHVDDSVLDVLRGTNRWLILLIALLIGVSMLDLSDRWAGRVSHSGSSRWRCSLRCGPTAQ
jgi:hypothetical protein